MSGGPLLYEHVRGRVTAQTILDMLEARPLKPVSPFRDIVAAFDELAPSRCEEIVEGWCRTGLKGGSLHKIIAGTMVLHPCVEQAIEDDIKAECQEMVAKMRADKRALLEIVAEVTDDVPLADCDLSLDRDDKNTIRWHAFQAIMRERTNFVADVRPDFPGVIMHNTSPATGPGDQAAFRKRMIHVAALAIAAVLASDPGGGEAND